jgi:hypothetical protein
VGGVQSHLSSARNTFVAKLNPSGNTLVYSTYLGGSGVDIGNAIAVDALGEAVIVGDTTSKNLPVTAGVFQRTLAGGQDVFVARLAANGASLSFLTYFGGNSTDHGAAVQIDPTGPIIIGGGTNSTNLPVLQAFQPHSGGGQDGFVAKFNATATGLVFSTYLGGSGGSPGFPEEVNALVLGGHYQFRQFPCHFKCLAGSLRGWSNRWLCSQTERPDRSTNSLHLCWRFSE